MVIAISRNPANVISKLIFLFNVFYSTLIIVNVFSISQGVKLFNMFSLTSLAFILRYFSSIDSSSSEQDKLQVHAFDFEITSIGSI